MIQDGIDVNRTTQRPYIGMPVEIDDEPMDNTGRQIPCTGDFENRPPAMAYVPWQHFEHVYEPDRALQVGTIFPELNKPFLGVRGGLR